MGHQVPHYNAFVQQHNTWSAGLMSEFTGRCTIFDFMAIAGLISEGSGEGEMGIAKGSFDPPCNTLGAHAFSIPSCPQFNMMSWPGSYYHFNTGPAVPSQGNPSGIGGAYNNLYENMQTSHEPIALQHSLKYGYMGVGLPDAPGCDWDPINLMFNDPNANLNNGCGGYVALGNYPQLAHLVCDNPPGNPCWIAPITWSATSGSQFGGTNPNVPTSNQSCQLTPQPGPFAGQPCLFWIPDYNNPGFVDSFPSYSNATNTGGLGQLGGNDAPPPNGKGVLHFVMKKFHEWNSYVENIYNTDPNAIGAESSRLLWWFIHFCQKQYEHVHTPHGPTGNQPAHPLYYPGVGPIPLSYSGVLYNPNTGNILNAWMYKFLKFNSQFHYFQTLYQACGHPNSPNPNTGYAILPFENLGSDWQPGVFTGPTGTGGPGPIGSDYPWWYGITMPGVDDWFTDNPQYALRALGNFIGKDKIFKIVGLASKKSQKKQYKKFINDLKRRANPSQFISKENEDAYIKTIGKDKDE